MTADVPRQPATEDIDIATIRALVRAGVVASSHRRWNEMRQAAFALGIRPEDAVYRVHDGIWSDHHHDPLSVADFIREEATR